ncbi:MAG: ATP-binding protein [Bdellovibrionales bacterium]|nr:ATP-binding protein [Bdellovibrionales bacterium]
MAQYESGAVFDEIQRAPELFSEIQIVADRLGRNSLFVLSGSQNFLLLEKVSQSLAGRTGILNLLPLSQAELREKRKPSLEERMFFGGYPRIFDQQLDPPLWLDAYVQTFIERDIRLLRNIADLDQFRLFIRMCAARSGQILELTSLGNDCGISSNTAKAWISLLETSFIVFRLQPYYKNFNKRLVKSPRLYFNDTGLLCYLLGLNQEALKTFSGTGFIWETYVLSELRKLKEVYAPQASLWFYRDAQGVEVDLILDLDGMLDLIEIKWTELVTAKHEQNMIKVESFLKKKVRSKSIIARAAQTSVTKAGTNVLDGYHLKENLFTR